MKFIYCLGMTLLLVLPISGLGGSVSIAQKYQQDAERSGLGSSPYWKRLLYYQYLGTPFEVSIIDTDEFFLADGGRHDPDAEMAASIAAFFRKDAPAGPGLSHAQCKFPLRLRFIMKSLNLKKKELPSVSCPLLKKYLVHNRYEGVSLVFSSYFLNSPSSMFGHTLFRFRKGKKPEAWGAGYSDVALNYAAFMDQEENQFSYVVKGLFGGFQARYQMLPYYAKIQEYNNHDRRDLWEYHLKMSAQELETMLLSVWEFGANASNYYFLTENCSYVLLFLLEIAKPDLNLVAQTKYAVIPTDIISIINQMPGLVTGFSYIPSSYSRYRERYARLQTDDKVRLAALVDPVLSPPVKPLIASLPLTNQAEVLDAALEWIDFSDKIASRHEGGVYQHSRRKILRARARIPLPAVSLTKIPMDEKPDLANGTNRVGLGLAYDHSTLSEQIFWRPAMFDLVANDTGLPKGAAISILDTVIRVDRRKQKLAIERSDFINVVSLQSFRSRLKNFSYRWRLGLRERRWNGQPETYGEIAVGLGVAHWFQTTKIRIWNLWGMQGDLSIEDGNAPELFGTAELGLLYRPVSSLRILLTGEFAGSVSSDKTIDTGQLLFAFDLMANTELRAGLLADTVTKAEVSLFRYF